MSFASIQINSADFARLLGKAGCYSWTDIHNKIAAFNRGEHVSVAGEIYCKEQSFTENVVSKTPKSILQEAQEVIYGDREKTYGAPDKNLQAIADLWSQYLYHSYKDKVSVNDVCNLMILMKVARLINSPEHHDSMVDICGYAALMERVQIYRHDQSKQKGESNEGPLTQSINPLSHEQTK